MSEAQNPTDADRSGRPVQQPAAPSVDTERQRQAQQFLRPDSEAPVRTLALVTIPGGGMTITQSAEALFRAIAPSKQLFYRGGAMVELLNEGEGYGIQVVDAVAAQSRFEKYVRFFKDTKRGDTSFPMPTNISEAIAKQYLKTDACRNLLPKLNGILHCPLLVEKDGQLHQVAQGYDETTGFFVATDSQLEEVPFEQAVSLLPGILLDFDFVTRGDRSRAIASLLTPALKLGGFIQGPVPVDVAEANASQSGKTYRQKLVAALYNQRPAVVTKKGGGVGSMEETFSDHLVKGRVFIQFDNVRGKLDSQYLESFLTAEGSFPARIPYHGTIAVDPSKFILLISSNGFEATKDLTNRASIIRIRKRENHQFHIQDGMDMLQFLFRYNSVILGCVFAVIREWHRQGKPKTNETRHDFREWCESLDWILQNLFHEAPLMDGHDAAKERASNPNLSFVRAVGLKLNEKNRLNQTVTASELCVEEDIDIPGASLENQTIEQAPQLIGKLFGNLFKNATNNELVGEEFRVVRSQESARSDAGNLMTLNRYTFSLINASAATQPAPPPGPAVSLQPTPPPA
jgi:hypothetical protein